MADLQLLPQQAEVARWIIEAPPEERIMVLVGAVRSGKTRAAVHAFLWHSERYKNENFIVAGATVGALVRNVLPVIEGWCNHYGVAHRWWPTKSYIDVGASKWWFFPGRERGAEDTIQGMTAAGLLMDEVVALQPEFVQQAMLRLSTPGARTIATCNPKGPRAWFKTDIIDKITSGEIPGVVQNWSIYDNTFLDKGYLEDVERRSFGHFRKRHLDGEWAQATGAVYSQARIVAGDPPPMRHYAAGIDYGSRNATACVVFGQAANGTWHGCAEYYYDGRVLEPRGPGDHADAIVELLSGRLLKKVIIDSQAAPLKIELRKRGVKAIPARHGLNTVAVGIQGLQQAFAEGAVTLYSDHIPETCSEFINLEYDERASERGKDVAVLGNDHSCDAVRYLFYALRPPRIVMEPKRKPKWL